MIAGFCSFVAHDPAEMLMIIWNLHGETYFTDLGEEAADEITRL